MALLGGYEDSGGRETYPRPYRPPTQSAGLPGGTAGPATPEPAPAPTPTPEPPRQYGLSGFDFGKLNDPNHKTFKYQFGRIARNYNPQQGIQAAMLDELNKLGFANFYGSGQHLGYKGVTAAGRAAGLDPYDFEGDFIQSWSNGQNPNATWQYDAYNPNPMPDVPPPQAQQAGFPGLEQWFQQMAMPQPPPQAPSISITNSGIDPQTLAALMATYQGGQPQQVSAPPYYAPSAVQTQAPPMMAPGPASGSRPVQTQGVTQAAPGEDPFMAWLRQVGATF